MTEKYTEQDLERIMRQGLAERAEEAADSLEEPLATRPGRRRNWLAAAAVAAALVVGVPLAWQAIDRDDTGPTGGDEVATDDGGPPAWRVESYGGVQVRVPPSWGWGGAPMRNVDPGDDRPLDCGAAAFVRPGSSDYEFIPKNTPYVGRPVMMTDACTVLTGRELSELGVPTSDSVWLDAVGVQPGTVDVGNGYVRETVKVGDDTVTVTSDDPELRTKILATAESVEVDANGCATDATWDDVPDGTLREIEPESLSVCSYMTYRGETTLVWSARRDTDDAAQYAQVVEESSANYDPIRPCTEQPDGEWLAIGVNGAGGKTAWTGVVMGECAQILWHYKAQGDPESLAASPVVPRTVAPWASSWTRGYLAGPVNWGEYAGKDGEGMFRGLLG
ncbi:MULTISPECIES: hypothetical protein [unclassified Nocardioides]|uniref:hypothetical protein n=1 Tax=unclassified Nocardioides TaxID=2615069 RepID=UPI0006F993A3|nr:MULTISPECIES: hypothetical protein [unclassified Nocardioides]KQY56610.1 hypothetical protein ASD30_09810 [Nocardioides sp. Root140]KQZ75369.1 hypothetical protein ASD66_03125 [Nocardioides sp. Root151]KRF14443.1 hypothetical protein ASH02_08915 [Nocardioides sp. Soil796]